MKHMLTTASGYPVILQHAIEELDQFINNGNYSKLVILGDTNTLEHCLPYLNLHSSYTSKADIIEIDAGEENKNIDICIGVWSMMSDFGMDRSSLLINLGGGMISDMGGFAASTYMRGIDYVNIPTSLLAMVDASIGGKTGLDLNSVKNQVGTFSFPKAVFLITELLETLPPREFRSGFAEIIKHGLIADEQHFKDALAYLEIPDTEQLPELISRSIGIKNNIVEQDPYEHNVRKLLNFGHTIGHSVESFFIESGSASLLHGEAIMVGMLAELYLSEKKNGLDSSALKNISTSLMQHAPAPGFDTADYETLIRLMRKDKKNTKGMISFSLLAAPGQADHSVSCSEEEIKEALDFYRSLYN